MLVRIVNTNDVIEYFNLEDIERITNSQLEPWQLESQPKLGISAIVYFKNGSSVCAKLSTDELVASWNTERSKIINGRLGTFRPIW